MKLTKQEFTGRFDGKVDELTIEKSVKDGNGIFTVVDYKRKGSSALYLKSTLSNPDVKGNYLTRTEKYYDRDGTTVIDNVVYTLTYDADGDLISEV